MQATLRAAFAATALLASASSAQLTVLSDNLSEIEAGPEPVGTQTWITASFGTDAHAYNLTNIELELQTTPEKLGNAVVDIYTSVGAGVGQPGVLVGSLTGPGSFSGSPFTFTASGIVLSASTTYWVVLKSTSGSGGLAWLYTWSEVGTGVGFQHTYGYTTNGGATWLTFDEGPQQMRVNAEPWPWTELGSALPGVAGAPHLDPSGTLAVGTAGFLQLASAAPAAPTLLFISGTSTPTSFKGGTLLPVPVLQALPLATDSAGSILLPWTSWPAGLSGLSLFFQCAIKDSAAVKGVALTNALRADVP